MPARRFALRTVLTLSLAALLVPVFAASAAASYATKVVISPGPPAFHGQLQSAKSSCISKRTVTLYRQRSGPDKQLGTDKSSRNGEWSISVGDRLSSGAYYARASARGACKAARFLVTVD